MTFSPILLKQWNSILQSFSHLSSQQQYVILSIQKGKQPSAKRLTSRFRYISLPEYGQVNKAGLFICAFPYCLSRQAAPSGSYQLKITNSKHGMYPSAPPPSFCISSERINADWHSGDCRFRKPGGCHLATRLFPC